MVREPGPVVVPAIQEAPGALHDVDVGAGPSGGDDQPEVRERAHADDTVSYPSQGREVRG